MKINTSLAISICAGVLMAAPISAAAMTYFLKKDMGVQENRHLCLYSNGKVYAFNAIDMCDMSVEDDGPPILSGQKPVAQTGFKSGEYMDGMTKVCTYNVMGSTKAVRINAVEMCPLNHAF